MCWSMICDTRTLVHAIYGTLHIMVSWGSCFTKISIKPIPESLVCLNCNLNHINHKRIYAWRYSSVFSCNHDDVYWPKGCIISKRIDHVEPVMIDSFNNYVVNLNGVPVLDDEQRNIVFWCRCPNQFQHNWTQQFPVSTVFTDISFHSCNNSPWWKPEIYPLP